MKPILKLENEITFIFVIFMIETLSNYFMNIIAHRHCLFVKTCDDSINEH